MKRTPETETGQQSTAAKLTVHAADGSEIDVVPESVTIDDRTTHTRFVTGHCIMTVISNTPRDSDGRPRY